jgi:hypothetical protein
MSASIWNFIRDHTVYLSYEHRLDLILSHARRFAWFTVIFYNSNRSVGPQSAARSKH